MKWILTKDFLFHQKLHRNFDQEVSSDIPIHQILSIDMVIILINYCWTGSRFIRWWHSNHRLKMNRRTCRFSSWWSWWTSTSSSVNHLTSNRHIYDLRCFRSAWLLKEKRQTCSKREKKKTRHVSVMVFEKRLDFLCVVINRHVNKIVRKLFQIPISIHLFETNISITRNNFSIDKYSSVFHFIFEFWIIFKS